MTLLVGWALFFTVAADVLELDSPLLEDVPCDQPLAALHHILGAQLHLRPKEYQSSGNVTIARPVLSCLTYHIDTAHLR